jgi:hypothetical protein
VRQPEESEFLKRVPRAVPNGTVEDCHYLPVSEERAVELIASLSDDRHDRFLVHLAHSLTVSGRGPAYLTDAYTDVQARARLRCINEMMHGLTAQIAAVVGAWKEARAYSPSEFCQSLYGKARACGFEREFAINDMSPSLRGALRDRSSNS